MKVIAPKFTDQKAIHELHLGTNRGFRFKSLAIMIIDLFDYSERSDIMVNDSDNDKAIYSVSSDLTSEKKK